jgi:hypothetical protein
LKGQAYKLGKRGWKFHSKTDKLRKISFIGREKQNKQLLLLALNVVQYYNVRLKVIAKVATDTTIADSEKRKQ